MVLSVHLNNSLQSTRSVRHINRMTVRKLCVLVTLGAALGCEGAARKSAEPQTVVVDAPSDLQVLNPLLDTDANTHQLLLHALFLPLVRRDEALSYRPALAASW